MDISDELIHDIQVVCGFVSQKKKKKREEAAQLCFSAAECVRNTPAERHQHTHTHMQEMNTSSSKKESLLLLLLLQVDNIIWYFQQLPPVELRFTGCFMWTRGGIWSR